jgi:hypothetical protein
MWLCLGLLITFGVGYFVQENVSLLSFIFSNNLYFFIIIAEVILALVLSVRIHKMSSKTATALYLFYTALTGLTFSSIFVVYELQSIIYVFLVTALILFVFGLIGYKTNLDLSKLGTILFIGLIAVILLSIVSIFVEGLNLGLTILSLIIFIGYIAYDVQMIKRRLYYADNDDSLAIYGAFQLYLDFINVFIDLLRLFGKER